MKKHIPNLITCCNLMSGCCAVWAAFHGYFNLAVTMILAGAVFDFFDGMVARLLHVSSPIGKELDSLADVVTFGVAPSALLFDMLGISLRHTPWVPTLLGIGWLAPFVSYIPVIAFGMAAFSAVRLAKFNLDERQTSSFIGLPTPANALFWCSMAMSGSYHFLSATSYLLLALALSLMLVAEIPLFALKFKNLSWRDNAVKYIFLAGCLVLIPLMRTACFAGIVIWYVLLSIVNNLMTARSHKD
ncbi:MAG: CDP-alcohol phosphatidyltransferase family protein [Bacteroidaceae bacterium]|nr:CDP-alcohol phosphatidyltransferase family protein [Bacteroidaceae bacterium]